MKKIFLTLTICLTLSTTCAFAENTTTQNQKIFSSPSNSSIKAIDEKPTIANPPKDEPSFNAPSEARKQIEDRMHHQRNLLYTSLNLSNEQIKKAEAIDTKTKAEAAYYIRNVRHEVKKLKDLEKKHASAFALFRQKNALKRAKSKADKFFAKSRKDFEALLTKDQLAKFREIDAAKKAEREDIQKRNSLNEPQKIKPKQPANPLMPMMMQQSPMGGAPSTPQGLNITNPNAYLKK